MYIIYIHWRWCTVVPRLLAARLRVCVCVREREREGEREGERARESDRVCEKRRPTNQSTTIL